MYGPKMAEKNALNTRFLDPRTSEIQELAAKSPNFSTAYLEFFPNSKGIFQRIEPRFQHRLWTFSCQKKSPLQPSWPCEVYFCEKSAVLPKTLKIHASWGAYVKNAPNDKKKQKLEFQTQICPMFFCIAEEFICDKQGGLNTNFHQDKLLFEGFASHLWLFALRFFKEKKLPFQNFCVKKKSKRDFCKFMWISLRILGKRCSQKFSNIF